MLVFRGSSASSHKTWSDFGGPCKDELDLSARSCGRIQQTAGECFPCWPIYGLTTCFHGTADYESFVKYSYVVPATSCPIYLFVPGIR